MPQVSDQQAHNKHFVLLAAGALALALVVFFFVFGGRFSLEGIFSSAEPSPVPPAKRINLDLSVFSTPEFQGIGDTREEIPYPDTVGRENPFLPL